MARCDQIREDRDARGQIDAGGQTQYEQGEPDGCEAVGESGCAQGQADDRRREDNGLAMGQVCGNPSGSDQGDKVAAGDEEKQRTGGAVTYTEVFFDLGHEGRVNHPRREVQQEDGRQQ